MRTAFTPVVEVKATSVAFSPWMEDAWMML